MLSVAMMDPSSGGIRKWRKQQRGSARGGDGLETWPTLSLFEMLAEVRRRRMVDRAPEALDGPNGVTRGTDHSPEIDSSPPSPAFFREVAGKIQRP
jgi:hypothetical protein